jgi:TadE-like protein
MRRRGLRPRGDSGAAALEFALVVPVFLLLVFGIIDFGIYFSDSLATRDGLRAAVRQGVVQDFGACQKLSCLADVARQQMDTLGGDKHVKLVLERADGNPPGWRRGNTLLICAKVDTDGVTHLTPLPDGGVIRARIAMRIEQDDAPPSDAGQLVADLPLSDWTDCP